MNNVIVQIVGENRLGKLTKKTLQNGCWNVRITHAREIHTLSYDIIENVQEQSLHMETKISKALHRKFKAISCTKIALLTLVKKTLYFS